MGLICTNFLEFLHIYVDFNLRNIKKKKENTKNDMKK